MPHDSIFEKAVAENNFVCLSSKICSAMLFLTLSKWLRHLGEAQVHLNPNHFYSELEILFIQIF
jgi:hypothetical protein